MRVVITVTFPEEREISKAADGVASLCKSFAFSKNNTG